MQTINSFKQYILSNYEADELQDIAQHGCANCAPGGMIYYNETSAIYNEYCDDLHAILGEWIDSVGETPAFITEHLDNAYHFKNAMVWFCAEVIAQEQTAEA